MSGGLSLLQGWRKTGGLLRTANALLQNLTTSVWVSDNFTVLPFRPRTELQNLHEDSVSAHISGTWSIVTRVYQSDYRCEEFKISNWTFANESFIAALSQGGILSGVTEMASISMSADDGCSYDISVAASHDFHAWRSLWWTNDWSLVYPMDAALGPLTNDPGALSKSLAKVIPTIGPTSPFLRVNASTECLDKDFIWMTDPMRLADVWTDDPKAFVSRKNPNRRGFTCSSNIAVAEIPVKMSLSSSNSEISFSVDDFDSRKEDVTPEALDPSGFAKLFRDSDWSVLSAPVGTADETTVLTINASLALFALGGYNITDMYQDPQLDLKASKLNSRLFAEVMQTSILQIGAARAELVIGQTTLGERRIVVILEFGVAVASLFFSCFCLFAVVGYFSRLNARPLNLVQDPATVLGAMAVTQVAKGGTEAWKDMFDLPRNSTKEVLKAKRYYTTPSSFTSADGLPERINSSRIPKIFKRWRCKKSSSGLKPPSVQCSNNPSSQSAAPFEWRPLSVRPRMLFALVLFLLGLLIAISVLSNFARGDRLYRAAFVSEINITFLKGPNSTLAPFSILPTLFAVLVGVWWDSLDHTFRTLQPYLSMTRPHGTEIANGLNMSYQSSYWVWAAAKAAKNSHWTLFLVTLGSMFCQLFTISTSALFERSVGNYNQSVQLNRSVELRQLPIIDEERFVPGDPGNMIADSELNAIIDFLPPSVYLAYRKNWMQSALNRLSTNASEPAWSMDGWSFVPVDISSVRDASLSRHVNVYKGPPGISDPFSAQNVSITSPAIRARLECAPISDISNVSSWLESYDLTDAKTWNVKANPKGFDIGYKLPFFDNTIVQRKGGRPLFAGTPWNTSAIGLRTPMKLCCNDNTTHSLVQNVTIGYWTPVDGANFPNPWITWPMNFVVKWIHGPARSDVYLRDYNMSESLGISETGINGEGVLLFTEVPQIQALTCKPTIETANALVNVNSVGRLLSYEILEAANTIDTPWLDPMVMYDLFPGAKEANTAGQSTQYVFRNMTTSYGVYFLSSLLAAAQLRGGGLYQVQDPKEGTNFDFMSQSMYIMTNKTPSILLNATNLASYSEQTFQSFFQHFVSRNISFDGTSMAYQPIGDTMPDLGNRTVFNFNSSAYKERMQHPAPYPTLQTNRSAVALVSTKIEVLRMNDVATYLSIGILIWLIVTTVIITILQRPYLRPLLRNIECLADVIVLVAGSDDLLALAVERGTDGLVDDHEHNVKLRWFGEEERKRWGIELLRDDDRRVV
ncbi:hypothetical protein BDV96DRAFT_571440 [Lophiotrema nucula]|uniref:Uncharacterized protein n=1 Tax=Lophiotrema nucula TaxID=690887 RepID=A0A6A5ZBY7_9PLEO|nr:hypothetical protein BDV96DRAFT_571440 [Lophiotrema nucula]